MRTWFNSGGGTRFSRGQPKTKRKKKKVLPPNKKQTEEQVLQCGFKEELVSDNEQCDDGD